MTIGTLAGAATLGLMIPPSLTLIVYGVTVKESISKLFIAGVIPGLMLASLFMLYIVAWYFIKPACGRHRFDLVWYLYRGGSGDGPDHTSYRFQPVCVAGHDQSRHRLYLAHSCPDVSDHGVDGGHPYRVSRTRYLAA